MLSKTPLHQFVDRTTLEPWRKALLDAADYIEKYGHWKGSGFYGDKACFIGSLVKVGISNETLFDAINSVENYVRCGVVKWNDAPERTPAEVMGAMRECALKGI